MPHKRRRLKLLFKPNVLEMRSDEVPPPLFSSVFALLTQRGGVDSSYLVHKDSQRGLGSLYCASSETEPKMIHPDQTYCFPGLGFDPRPNLPPLPGHFELFHLSKR